MAMQLQDALAASLAREVIPGDNRFEDTPFDGVDSETLALAQKIDASISKMRDSNFYVEHPDSLEDDIMTVSRLNPDIAKQLCGLSDRSKFNNQPYVLLSSVVFDRVDLYSEETLQKVRTLDFKRLNLYKL